MKTFRWILFIPLLFMNFTAVTPELTSAERKSAIDYLTSTKKDLLKSIKGLSEAQLTFKGSPESWSIKKCVEQLQELNPSPSVLLNKAIVISKIEGAQKAIDEIRAIPQIEKLLHTHYLFPATLGELYRHPGKTDDAKPLLQMAMALTHSPSEKALLERKLNQMF